ncbi:MAG: major capsid protein V20 domain-containing protein, partial [Candidatus Fonsibacter sp.]
MFEDAPSFTINSSNIQLSGIPDKLIIFVRKPPSLLRCEDTDCFATIPYISLNFNNQAGLRSSMTPEQLYRNSIQSGLTNVSWDEFCGTAVSV